MNKITKRPFINSISLFGLIALIVSISDTLFMGKSFIYADYPYIIGFFIASINTIAAFIYFLLKELNLNRFKPIISVITYYTLVIVYCFLIELSGGEASGWGYHFLGYITFSLPIFILFIFYSRNTKVVSAGIVSGAIYALGYVHILINI